jgi:hypothetical protein
MKIVYTNPRKREHPDLMFWASLALLVIFAGFFRFYRLDTQLWLDEISGLHNYRKPFLEILTTFPGHFPNPLYELLAHASLVLLGESALAIRLPAALFGVAGVLIFYRLARRFSGPREALFAGALFAVSYHHIFFSQNARGYTAFLFFALAATDILLKLIDSMRWHTALAYVGLAAMTTYAHPFGLFVPAGQMLIALPVAWFRRRQGYLTAPAPIHLLAVAMLTNLTILILYAPFIRESIAFSLTAAKTAGHGPRILSLLPELLEGLRAGFSGWPVVILAAAVGTIGTLDLLRREPVALATLVAPLIVAAAVVGTMGLGVHARYFILALPIGYLVGIRGVVLVARTFLEQGLGLPSWRSLQLQRALAVLMVLLAVVPLIRYYTYPKQDYLGALSEVRALAAPADRVVAADLAGHAIRDYYAPNFPVVEDLSDLLHEEATGCRVWVVTTLERVVGADDPLLMTHLHRNYQLIQVLPGTLGDGAMRIYKREPMGSPYRSK